MNSRLISVSLLLSVLAFGACKTDDTTPLVATNSPLAPEAVRPMVAEGEVPEQQLLDPNRVVARVNDQIITVRTITSEIGEAIEAAKKVGEEEVRRLLADYSLRLIVRRLQVETAQKLGITVTPEDMKRAEKMADTAARKRGTTLIDDLEARGEPRWEWDERQRRIILADKYMAMAMGEMQPVSPETRAIADTRIRPSEVRSYYDRHPELFQQDKVAKVDAIFIRFVDFDAERNPGTDAETWAERRARALIARARRGEAFGRLVQEVHGKPLEAFQKPFRPGERNNDYVEEFAWKGRVGDVSEPFPLGPGLLILKLARKTSDRTLAFDEVKDEIAKGLLTLRRTAALLKIQTSLLRDAVIEPRGFKEQIRALMARDMEKVLIELSK